jgi:predicted nucleotidyltransferase
MKTKDDKEILDLFLQEMKEKLGHHLKQVILFGSRARGDFSPDSDYDCLLVMNEIPPDTENIIDDITGELLYQHDALFSIFPILEETYHRQKYDPFLMNIRQEGIPL